MSEFGRLLPKLYATERSYGWSIGMRAVNHALLGALAPLPDGPILEAGCGGGLFLAELAQHFPDHATVGLDLSTLAIEHARRTASAVASIGQGDVERLPFADATFGTLLAFDTLDQRGVDAAVALRESWRILQPGGMLILRVSAHEWLWGAHDTAFNTGRRFQLQALVEAIQNAGFEVVRVTYANMLLAVPAAALRLLQRRRLVRISQSQYGAVWPNRVLATALRLESVWLRRRDLPAGLSLVVAACKGVQPIDETSR